MAWPKKKIKYTHEIHPPKVGTEYLKYGFDRIEELMRQSDVKTKYLPRTILIEDLDQAAFDYISQNENMNIVIDGRKVPCFYLENDRWGELSKTWKFVDNDKNVPTPYITVRRVEKAKGTRLGTKHRIPQPRKFTYLNVPILDAGEIIYLLFKMPEPVNVDLIYEMSLFTKYRVDVNLCDEQILKNFSSHQDYVFIKGTPLPFIFEKIAESNTIENIDNDRFFVSKYTFKLQGIIRDEKEYEIVKALRKPRFGYVVE